MAAHSDNHCPYHVGAWLQLLTEDGQLNGCISKLFEGSIGDGFTYSCTLVLEEISFIQHSDNKDGSDHIVSYFKDQQVVKLFDWRYSQRRRADFDMSRWSTENIKGRLDSTTKLGEYFNMLIHPMTDLEREHECLAPYVKMIYITASSTRLSLRKLALTNMFAQEVLQAAGLISERLTAQEQEVIVYADTIRAFRSELDIHRQLAQPDVAVLPNLRSTAILKRTICEHEEGEKDDFFEVPAFIMDLVPGCSLSVLQNEAIKGKVEEAPIAKHSSKRSSSLLPLSEKDTEDIVVGTFTAFHKALALGIEFIDSHASNINVMRNCETNGIEVMLFDSGAFRKTVLPVEYRLESLEISYHSPYAEKGLHMVLGEAIRDIRNSASIPTFPEFCSQYAKKFPDPARQYLWNCIIQALQTYNDASYILQRTQKSMAITRAVSKILLFEMEQDDKHGDDAWWRRAGQKISTLLCHSAPQAVLDKLDYLHQQFLVHQRDGEVHDRQHIEQIRAGLFERADCCILQKSTSECQNWIEVCLSNWIGHEFRLEYDPPLPDTPLSSSSEPPSTDTALSSSSTD